MEELKKVKKCAQIIDEETFFIPWYFNEGELTTLPNNMIELSNPWTWGEEYIKYFILADDNFNRAKMGKIYIHDIAVDEPEGTVYGDLYLDIDRVLCRVIKISNKGLNVSIKGCNRGKMLREVIKHNPDVVRIGCCFIPNFAHGTITWNKFTINLRYS